ncbi:MAG: hypothetical protein ACE14S_08210 [Candidatus Bathyarchaeia archaeon]
MKKADYAVILCREDCQEEIESWHAFFARLHVSVICIAISKKTGLGSVEVQEVIRATLIGLDRRLKIDEAMMRLAMALKERLSLQAPLDPV